MPANIKNGGFHEATTSVRHLGTKPAQRKPLGTFALEPRQDHTEETRLVRVLTTYTQKDTQTSYRKSDGQHPFNLKKQLVISHISRPSTLPSTRGVKIAEESQSANFRGKGPPSLTFEVSHYLATQVPIDLEQALYQQEEYSSHHSKKSDEQDETMSLLTFSSEERRSVYAITTPEGRISSNAKRRRWGIQVVHGQSSRPNCQIMACMEFKKPDERGLNLSPEDHLENVKHELTQLSRFNRDISVHSILRTADGYLLAFMTNLPEESSYLLERTSDQNFDYTFLRIFYDAVHRLDLDIHQPGFVHGDFKLQNVMMTATGRASLIDFEALSQLDESGQADIIGTTYAPPEQNKPQNERYKSRFGCSGDVFAVGLAMFDSFAEREAINLNHQAEVSRHEALLNDMATEIRLNKEKIIIEMLNKSSSFYSWRQTMLSDGYSASRILSDTSVFAKSLYFMATRLPELFEHWFTCLASENPVDRPNLTKTSLVLEALLANPKYSSKATQAHQSMISIIGESMSASVEPALKEAIKRL